MYGDGHLISGSLPISVSHDENRPSYRDTCLDVSADLRLLELSSTSGENVGLTGGLNASGVSDAPCTVLADGLPTV